VIVVVVVVVAVICELFEYYCTPFVHCFWGPLVIFVIILNGNK
jgi:hypothetical protein